MRSRYILLKIDRFLLASPCFRQGQRYWLLTRIATTAGGLSFRRAGSGQILYDVALIPCGLPSARVRSHAKQKKTIALCIGLTDPELRGRHGGTRGNSPEHRQNEHQRFHHGLFFNKILLFVRGDAPLRLRFALQKLALAIVLRRQRKILARRASQLADAIPLW